jgi:hypothetical protein
VVLPHMTTDRLSYVAAAISGVYIILCLCAYGLSLDYQR